MSAAEVRAARERLGLTQLQAARRWNVSQTYLSLMEHGKRPVPNRLARLVARGEPRMATALRTPAVPARVTEALPWVLLTFAHLDWDWLVGQAKLANLQNRLGYLVTLTREVAERRGESAAVQTLADVGRRLEEARLVREDTLGRELTEVERRHLRVHRPVEAAHWNLLTSLRSEDLRYAR